MRVRPAVLVLALAGLVLPAHAAAQAAPGGPPSADALLRAARDLMQAVRYCALATVDASGQPQVRTMDVFPPDDRLVVWFATNPRSRKVAQIRRNPRVALHYYDAARPELGYVTVLGRARLVDDPGEKQKRWKDGWEAFWPNRDEAYLLVEVVPDRVEMFSPAHGIAADPVTWQPAGVALGTRR